MRTTWLMLRAAAIMLWLTTAQTNVIAELVGHWTFNEGNGAATLADTSGSTLVHDATVNGAVVTGVAGKIGNAISTPGTSTAFATAPMGTDLVTGATPTFTASTWINLDSLASSQNGFYSYGPNGPAGRNFRLGIEGDDITFRAYGGFVRWDTAITNASGWHHIVATVDNANNPLDTKLFVDGVEVTQSGSTYDATPFNLGATDIFFGRASDNTNGFDGQLDDAAYWTNALSATEIKALFELADESALNYDAGEVQSLLDLFAQGSGSTIVDGTEWYYVGNGLDGGLGVVAPNGDGFDLQLAANGSGLTTEVAIPEPASIAIWSLIGLGLAGFGYYRVRRKQ